MSRDRHEGGIVNDPNAFLTFLRKRYESALQDWAAEQARLEQVRGEVGPDRNAIPNGAALLVAQYLKEGRALERYREAQRDYVQFLQFVTQNEPRSNDGR